MNSPQKGFLSALTLAALSAGVWAQTQTASNVAPAKEPAATVKPSADTELRDEVEQLKQIVREQQLRIDALEGTRKPALTEPTADAAAAPAAKALEAANSVQKSTATSTAASASPQEQNLPATRNVQAGSSDERIRNLE